MHLLCVLFVMSTNQSCPWLGQGLTVGLHDEVTLIFTLNVSNPWLPPLILSAPEKGHFSILIPVESDLAPLARLLLYIILPGGEVVADTVKYEIGNCLANKVGVAYNQISTFRTSSPFASRSFYTCVNCPSNVLRGHSRVTLRNRVIVSFSKFSVHMA